MNAMLKNILFPTDFSENAKHALPFALNLAKKNGATLHILHSIEEPYDFAPMAQEIKDGVTGKVERLLEELIIEIQKDEQYVDIPIKRHIETGRAIHSIIEANDSYDMDFIVMGTEGRSKFRRFLFGSTTAEVVQSSEIPVLVIPVNTHVTDFNQIIFATDYEDGDLEALNYVVELAKLFEARIKIYHTTLESTLKSEIKFRGFREIVKEAIAYEHIDFEEEHQVTLFEGIANQIEKEPVSLLVMVHYDKPFYQFGRRNESKDMSHYIQVPLLVLRGNSEKLILHPKELSETDESI